MESSPPPAQRARRDWQPAELERLYRLHHDLVTTRWQRHYDRLEVSAGGAPLLWKPAESAALHIDLDATATAIVVRSADPEPETPGGDGAAGDRNLPMVVNPILRYGKPSPRPEATRVALGGGRMLTFRTVATTCGRRGEAGAVEIRYREAPASGLAQGVAIFWQAFRAVADQLQVGRLAGDFCLADLDRRDFRQPAVWQALLTAFVLAPALVAGLVAATLWTMGVSPPMVQVGCIAGALVALTGTVVCSASVSLVAAGTGGIPISVVLGASAGLLLQSRGSVARAVTQLDGLPVVAGMGGMAALLRAPLLSVALTAVAIAVLGLAMGRVRGAGGAAAASAGGGKTPKAALRALAVAVLGAAGPGLVYGIGLLGRPGRPAATCFAVGLGIVGGTAFGASAAIRTGRVRRGIGFGVAYLVLVCTIVACAYGLVSPLWRLLFATTVNHILLQGTFFAFAYVLAEKLDGPRHGVAASLLEGVPPYCIFILTRPFG